jgi:hypothetical protein
MTPIRNGKIWMAALVAPHLLLSYLLLIFFSSPPVVEIEMSSSVVSRAQVYWDVGAGMSEVQSSSQPVRGGSRRQSLRFPIPNGTLLGLRFDPLTCPGTIVIHRAVLIRSDRSSLPIDVHLIRGTIGFDLMEFQPDGVKYHIRTDSLDPQTAIDLHYPIDLRSTYPGNLRAAGIVAANALLLAVEFLLLLWEPGFRRTKRAFLSVHSGFASLAERLSSPAFIRFDATAIWLYCVCILLFVIASALNLNGSSLGIDWLNYKVGAPAQVLAGVPQGIRADEIYYQTPYMLNQYFRADPFQMAHTPSGSSNVGLLAELPVKHVTTWFRPQFWPFFVLPADYAYATWWQAKGLILFTGVFTLLLLITGSSWISLLGALWLLFSQFTQWCYSWPSMLPEMCGLLCFTVIFALYLTVGRNRIALAACALGAAACAINFALTAYVPHEIPYAWVGAFVAAGWMIGHRADILRPEQRFPRAIALGAFFALTGILLLTILNDTREAVAGIAATTYPGHRLLNGGGLSFTTLATHFLAASETATRFPPAYSNINEASGFFWLAPVTLLCVGRMRALSTDRRILLAALWILAIILTAWVALPVPAAVGHWMFLDRVQSVRVLPALGLLNICIVMLVLSAPSTARVRLGLDAKLTLAFPVVICALVAANQNLQNYFTIPELLLGALWVSILAVCVWDGRLLSFATVLLIPSLLLFALVNPVERGIFTVTASPLFELVQQNPKWKTGRWIVFNNGYPPSIFTAVGCDVINGMRYLPDLKYFPLLAAHGVDTGILNNLGYLNIGQAKPGEAPRASMGPYGPNLSVDPMDPLVKGLGVRYVAFHDLPSEDIRSHLKQLVPGTVSEFWLYEMQ